MSEHSPKPRRWRIVATDDDPKLLAQVTYALRGAGHIVFAAYNGHTALHLASTTPGLDLLITNTRILGVRAEDLIKQVRARRPELPVLHIGEPLSDEEVTGGIPTLREPVSSDQLLKAVAKLLDPAPRD